MTTMHVNKERSRFHIGMRNVKTAHAAMICALIYFPLDRNPTFACIGAIFGMGGNTHQSRLGGGNRFFGTIIGGFLGMLFFSIYIKVYPKGGTHPLMLLFVFMGVVLLIIISQLIHWPGAIQPGGVMLCIILFNTPVDTYISYSLNRIIDTGIGVLIALAINWLLPRERMIKWLKFLKLRKED